MELTPYQGPERRWQPKYLAVGPLEIPYVTRAEALRTIDRSFYDRVQICLGFINANTVVKALGNTPYAELLSHFLVLNDGVGVDLCSLMLSGERFECNLNGTDFIPDLLDYSRSDLKIFLLGGKPGTAQIAARKLAARFPRHTIVGTHHGYFGNDELSSVLDAINGVSPDLLLVGLGNPLQEEFIFHNRNDLNVPVLAGVGAFLDFTAGVVARAPYAVRMLRLEWLFRLAQEPRRLGARYTTDLIRFFIAVFRMRFCMPSRSAIVRASANVRRLRKTDVSSYKTPDNKCNFG